MKWRRSLRAGVALVGLATILLVYLTSRQRPDTSPVPTVTRVDPKAVAESGGGRVTQASGIEVPGFVDFERHITYADGSVRFIEPTVTTERAGRTFVVDSKEGHVAQGQAHMRMTGDVVLKASDGLEARTGEATYSSGEEIVRAPGRVDFTRGALTGSGVGMTYDQARDVLWLLDQTRITVAAEAGDPGAVIVADAAGLARADGYMRFEGGVTITRAGREMSADSALVYLTEDEQAVRAIELRNDSRIAEASPVEGGLEAMNAKDINLTYGLDGEQLERAALAGNAVIQLAGGADGAGRRIAGQLVDITFDEAGGVSALNAREDVELMLPALASAPARTIEADRMDGTGAPGQGLTSASFTGAVEYREAQAEGARVARSSTLEVALAGPGGALDEAHFAGGTTFEDGATTATAADARYDVTAGRLALSGAVGNRRPRVQDARIEVDADAIQLGFEGPLLEASGTVKSVLKPAKTTASDARPVTAKSATSGTPQAGGPATARAGGPTFSSASTTTSATTTASTQPNAPASSAARTEPRTPGLLKNDQPANVTAPALTYDGGKGRAVYTGGARLWQGDTAISGESITIDESTGDLLSSGQVRSTLVLEQTDSKTGERKQVPTIATAEDLHYEDAFRRATYTTNAHVNGPQGDLRAVKIELYFVEAGGSLERAEAYEKVRLEADARTATGARMTYYAADEKYVMSGAPVRILEVDECRETTGKTLTFWRSTDRILVDGNEENRTLTKSVGTCGEPPRE